jgi:hypothetical protein
MVFEFLETISVNTTPPTTASNGKNALAAPEDFGKLFTLLRQFRSYFPYALLKFP